MRLFVGLDLPWELRERLALLAGGIPGARWVPVENYHITLRFIGEVAGHQAEEIDHALAGLRARGFSLTTRAGVVVRDATSLGPGDEIETRLASGQVRSRVF